jgi:enoyl-CoA hydratase
MAGSQNRPWRLHVLIAEISPIGLSDWKGGIMSAPNFEPLLVREEGSTLVVTINRPEALNALNNQVLTALQSLLDWVEGAAGSGAAPSHLRAMVLTGAGEKAFVAGADIKEFVDMNPQGAEQLAAHGQELFTRMERLPIPVIAAVNGFALGGGLELALACDFIYASQTAKFGLPECTLGLMPGFGGTVRLPRRIGSAKARELTYTGGMIGAEEALQLGLAAKVVAPGELMAAALETAKTIGSRAPVAVAMIKKSVHEGASLTEEQANELEARLFGELFATQDKVEGVTAFIEKRKPVFQGK